MHLDLSYLLSQKLRGEPGEWIPLCIAVHTLGPTYCFFQYRAGLRPQTLVNYYKCPPSMRLNTNSEQTLPSLQSVLQLCQEYVINKQKVLNSACHKNGTDY